MLYPDIEPFDHGMLDVGDGNLVYWEMCGNPRGRAALVLHGGPGSGCGRGLRRYFDPHAYRIVLFDQRGCGRSTPHASATTTDLSVNTTGHLLGDIELLRGHLGIERWLVLGNSWGSTLGLAYAERYPAHVDALVLVAVTTTRPSEIEWLYHDVGPLLPGEWERFLGGIAGAPWRCGHDVIEAYHRLLLDPDPTVHQQAAREFSAWEWAVSSIPPTPEPPPGWLVPDFQLARARIVTHFFKHDAWLEDGTLLRNAGALTGIPGVMVHGRLDLGSPLVTAWELARAWPEGELVVVPGAGHATTDVAMSDAVVSATDRFASGAMTR